MKTYNIIIKTLNKRIEILRCLLAFTITAVVVFATSYIYLLQKENEELKQEIISQQFLLDITIFEAQILIDEKEE